MASPTQMCLEVLRILASMLVMLALFRKSKLEMGPASVSEDGMKGTHMKLLQLLD